MALSLDNLNVLQHVFKRPIDRVEKVTLTLDNLGKVMEAVRLDERATIMGEQLDAMTAALKGQP